MYSKELHSVSKRSVSEPGIDLNMLRGSVNNIMHSS